MKKNSKPVGSMVAHVMEAVTKHSF